MIVIVCMLRYLTTWLVWSESEDSKSTVNSNLLVSHRRRTIIEGFIRSSIFRWLNGVNELYLSLLQIQTQVVSSSCGISIVFFLHVKIFDKWKAMNMVPDVDIYGDSG